MGLSKHTKKAIAYVEASNPIYIAYVASFLHFHYLYTYTASAMFLGALYNLHWSQITNIEEN